MFILKIVRAFDDAKVDYAVVGGMAVALQGLARGTMDLDLVINLSQKDFEAAEEVLSTLGLSSRIPVNARTVFQFRKEYIENKNLIAWSFVNAKAPHEVVDILLTQDRKKIKINLISVAGYKVKTASIEALIKMKTESGRPQDLEDIKGLKELVKK